MTPAIIAHYHEIALKGRNREMFERQLVENIRWAVRDVGGARVQRMSGRIAIRTANAQTQQTDLVQITDALTRVFGIANILIGHEVRQEYAALAEDVVRVMTETIAASQGSTAITSFCVRVKRGNKQYPKNSMELERELGAAIVDATGLAVNLGHPDCTVYVEIVERTAFVFTRKLLGPGGLPVGVSGRVLCLISSGFDSPVAAWKLMRRGCIVDFVHFHSYPYTSDASLRNVEEIVGVLQRWQQACGELYSIPLIEYQKQVMMHAPSALRVLLYRRMMFRIAEQIAKRRGMGALVTGESVGQVASQTIPNIAAVEAVVDLPVLRPLIGEDKQDIIAQAERIGTAEYSARPYDDCCSLFTPEHPATRARSEELDAAEAPLDAKEWVTRLLAVPPAAS
ncbi:MAG: tRNA uracil 4-sulfurtransferase ThiI [bacterium]|nr:tRNA uracil 4-sulfurtransferase ThiI [bacterium]